MYIAHVKVAFYIYMFETYDIDLLPKLDNPFMYSQDVQMQENSSQMRYKHFFINFQAYNIPTELNFCDSMDTHVKEYCNENDQVSALQQAPVMDAHSTRSNMHDWTAANVAMMPTPGETAGACAYTKTRRRDGRT